MSETWIFNCRASALLVSGSTAGIGFAIARELAAEGASVIVNGRTEQRTSAAVAAFATVACRTLILRGIAADLGSAEGCATMVQAAPEIDILVNNVGIFEAKPFGEISDAEWLHFFEVNVLSGVRLSRAYLPAMLQRNWGSHPVHLQRERAADPGRDDSNTARPKTAQLAVARGLAEMTVGTAVTVNCILPGPTKSEGVADS